MPSFLEQQKWCHNIGVGMRPAASELRAVLSVKMWVWDTHLKPWSTQDESLSQLFSVSCPVISASSTWRAAGMCCFCEALLLILLFKCEILKFYKSISYFGNACSKWYFLLSRQLQLWMQAEMCCGRNVCTVFFHVRKYSAFSICFLFQPSF